MPKRSQVKLSCIADYPAATRCWCLATLAAALSACASTPSQPVVERLDPDTATTLIALKKPVELVAETLHVTGGDPFAFLGPFETDRMGNRVQYLWVSAPGVENAKIEPRLLCDGQPVTLSPADGDLAHLGLSRAPYEKPAPWSVQWYFQLPPETLKCLADARGVTLESHASTGQSDQFSVDSKGLAPVKAFSTH
jgi:hypothetical protein